jgi:DNA polymerase beta
MPRTKKPKMSEQLNEDIIKNLRILEEYERIQKNPYKAVAYARVIENIELLDKKIQTVEDFKEIKGIGKKIEDKIIEFLETGKMHTVENALQDQKYILGKQLLGIYGIGPVKIQELLEIVHSFDELKNHMELLNEKQKIGLKYYDDLQQRIPKKEGREHLKIIKNSIKHITKDKNTVFEMVGSYRRKAKDMGDIDILIKEDPKFNLSNFINYLQETGYIIEILASGKNKFMGICKLSADLPARRIDILVAEPAYYYFALLYFTGSYNFNIYMRRIALQRGLSLSEYGFKDLKTQKLIDTSENIKSEEDIFKLLEIPYVMPDKR